MEEEAIIIEDSNVEKILDDVLITEEKLKEDRVLILNNEQIIHELTNIFFKNYNENLDSVKRKVNIFIDLLKNETPANKFNYPIRPIILCNKYMIVNDDKTDIDADFQNKYLTKVQKLQSFINQFDNLNNDKNNEYLQTVNTLYSLQKPFVNVNNDSAFSIDRITTDKTVDAFRHFVFKDYDKDSLAEVNINKFETFRIIPKIQIDTHKRPEQADTKPGCIAGLHYISIPNDVTLYDGDVVDIIGYTNIPDANINNIESFDINQYVKYLYSLAINTHVDVYFNDFVFDKTNKIIDKLDAIITSNSNGTIVLQFNKILIIDNIETKFFKIEIEKPSKCFIYDNTYKNYRFCKSCIKKDNIIFYLYKSSQLTLDFIIPQTISEIFFNNIDLFNDMHDFKSIKKIICNNYDIPFDNIPISLKTVFSIILKSNILKNPLDKQKPNFKYNPHHESIDFLKFNKNCYKELYLSTQKYVDSTLFRYSYLKNKRDYGYLYLLNLLKSQLKQKHENLNRKTFHEKIENIKKEIDQLNFSKKTKSPKRGRISKIYNSIEEAENDYGVDIVYDKELDPTKYKILSKFDKNLPYKELQYKIIEELLKDKEYFKYSQNELEDEASFIINGKRNIKVGDFAVVYLDDSSILYTRRNITNKNQDMWIKTMKTPFHLCSDNLPLSEDLENANILALDPFDILCKKIEEIRKNNIYQQLISQISTYESIISFIDDYANIIDDIDKDIQYYKHSFLLLENKDESIASLEKLRRNIKIILPSLNKEENYSEYIGNIDEFDIDKVYNNVDFNDKDEFHALYLGKQDTMCPDLTCNESNDILNVFIVILKIDIPIPIKEYIINQVNTKYPLNNIQEQLDEEKRRLFAKNVNKKLYNENKEYKIKADTIISDKVKQHEIKLLKSHYYNVILYIAALLNLIIMTEYPNIIIKNFVPKCTKHFSYIGHPLAVAEQQQTLTIFFACIIASLGTPDDIKFDQFSSMKLQDIVDNIKNEIDKILEENTHIALKLEEKENTLKMIKDKKTSDFTKYTKLNANFRPNFGHNINTQNLAVQFIKNINNIISNDRFFKHNMFHIPFISNSCCIESLNKNTNFYDYFTKNNTFKNVTKKDIITDFTNTISYIPESAQYKYDNLFIKKQITTTSHVIDSISLPEFDVNTNFKKFINDNIAFKNDPVLADKIDIDVILQQSDNNFKFITNLIKMYYNKFDNNLVDNIYILLISMQSFNNKYINLRNLLLSFIQFKLSTIISKIFNGKKLDSNSDILYNEILALTSEEYRASFGPKIKDLLNNSFKMISNLQLESKEESDIITNNAIIVYCLFKFLYGFLYLTVNEYNVNSIYTTSTFSLNQVDKNDKKNLNISVTIIYYILTSLTNFFNINNCDNDVIKNKIEELRERRKELLMENLEKDDEARKTQLLLKKFGIPIKIDEKIIHKDILVHDNELQEQQNYNIDDYKGDNAEDLEYEEELYANNQDY